MSLLMDALRKAEEAKRAAGGDGPPAAEPGLESPGAAVEGIPAELDQYERVAEIVDVDPERKRNARERYKQYRERGCTLESHNV